MASNVVDIDPDGDVFIIIPTSAIRSNLDVTNQEVTTKTESSDLQDDIQYQDGSTMHRQPNPPKEEALDEGCC